MTKHISTHITAALSGATSLLALIHPGFHLNPVVQGFAFALPAIFAAAIEALHFVKTHSAQADLIAAEHAVKAFLAAQPVEAKTTPAEEPKPVA